VDEVLKSEQFAQWRRLGLAEVATDDGEGYARWTAAGARYAPAAERFAATELAAGRPLPAYVRLERFDGDGFALVDED
jgi:hypothetical protein